MADYNTIRPASAGVGLRIDEGLRAHMNKVYGLMSGAMVLTGLVAYIVGTTPALQQLFFAFSPMSGIKLTALGWIAVFAPLVVVFAISAGINRMSAATAQMVFFLYAGLVGLSLSSIFLAYTSISITQTFLVTAIGFAGLSLYGYTTKRDLTGMGSFLMMGLFGIIGASVLNLLFFHSLGISFAVSVLGVLIFAGLTAYDTQSIKSMYVQMAQSGDSEWLGKSAIMGALRLYLDFLNMFMFLLQFMGNRN